MITIRMTTANRKKLFLSWALYIIASIGSWHKRVNVTLRRREIKAFSVLQLKGTYDEYAYRYVILNNGYMYTNYISIIVFLNSI